MKLPLLQIETERLMIRPFQNDDYESWIDGFKKRLPAQNMLTLCLQQEFEDICITAIHPGKLKTDIGAFDADMTPAEGARNIYEWVVAPHAEASGKFIEPGVGELKW